jgi:dienelactone hydrolase
MIFLRSLLFIAVMVTASFIVATCPGRAEGLRTDLIKIPIVVPDSDGEIVQLEAMVVRPDDDEPHPLAVINHGTPRATSEVKTMSPYGLWGPARVFAQRGWAALVVLRRGYGASEGGWADQSGSCANPDYIRGADVGADDIVAAVTYMRAQPYVRKDKWIAVGASAGGLATLAVSARMPQGLAAAIVFAPGRGSISPDELCHEERLTHTFAYFGRTSRAPILWISAENDHFFGPRVVNEWTDAFSGTGGHLTFVPVGAFGEDGHYLFGTRDGFPIWEPIVDRFLAANDLTLRDSVIEVEPPYVAPPTNLDAKGRNVFEGYLAEGPNKAFAVAGDGSWGWAAGRRSVNDARRVALEYCQKYAKDSCAIANVNNQPAN